MPTIHPIILLIIHCIREQMPKCWERSRTNSLLSLSKNLSEFEVKCILFFFQTAKLNLQPKQVLKHLKQKDYLNTQKTIKSSFHKYCTIRSYKHILKTIEITKKCLSAYDDKRYILSDGVHTIAHSHFRIADLNAQVGVHEMKVDE